MTATALLPPIAAATVLNCFLFALAWRGNQAEHRTGETSWLLGAIIMGYSLALGGFFYLHRDAPLLTGFERFMAAVAAECFGGLVVFALLHAFVQTRGQPWRDRAFPIFVSLMLTGGIIAALIQH